jgi:hypothetical protein
MIDYLSGFWQEIVSRPEGPMAFRFYLQPIMSTIYAILSGVKDARENKPPYFVSLLTDPSHRADRLRDGWKSVRNVFFLAIGMDLVYQLTVLKAFRPVQAVLISVVLALVPYVIIRGQVDRLARRFVKGTAAGDVPRRS